MAAFLGLRDGLFGLCGVEIEDSCEMGVDMEDAGAGDVLGGA